MTYDTSSIITPNRNIQTPPPSSGTEGSLNDNSVIQQAGPRIPVPLPNPGIPLTAENKSLTGRISSNIPNWETALQNWVNQAPSLEYYDRIDVAEKIRDCYARGEATLDLRSSRIRNLEGIILPAGLTTLDLRYSLITSLKGVTLPAGLTTLDLRSCRIKSLEEVTLPDGLTTLNLRKTLIGSLEGLTLPAGLKNLDLSDNRITSLEGLTLPSGLTRLDLSLNQITSLEGITFPAGLTTLDLTNNRIRNLEGLTLPVGLTTLNLGCNHIRSLEGFTLPSGLTMLDLSDNRITSLEGLTLPTGLTTLNLKDTWITSIPLELASFPSNCRINTEQSRIGPRASMEFQQAIDAARAQNPSQGPIWQTTIYEKRPPGTHSFEKLLDDYLSLAKEFLHRPQLTWPAFDFSEDEKALLSEFLSRLKETADFRNVRTQGGVVATVYNFLLAACTSEDFKNHLFSLIHDALDSCGDRVAITLNRIDLQRRLDTSVDIDLLIGYRRLQLLHEAAAKTIQEKGLGDAIEPMLYLQVRLRESLNLPIATEGMLYPAMASISDEELKKIEEYVLSQTTSKEDIFRILTETPSTVYDNKGKPVKENGVSVTNPFNFSIPDVWNKHLEKTYPERFKAIEPTDDEIYRDPYLRGWEERKKQLIQELTSIVRL